MKKRVVVLDGATGTELQRRGMPIGVCPEVWCLEHPRVLKEVQKAYVDAGAEVIYTCTFGGNAVKLAEFGRRDVTEMNTQLAGLTREIAGTKILVAGDIGPTGRLVEPFGDLPFEEAVAIFKEQVRGLIAGGVDMFVIETMMDIQEARAALLAVKELGDFFTVVTMTFEQGGRTLGGTDPVTAVITLQSLGADAVGCNCSAGPTEMIPWIEAMNRYATVPLVAKPNAGLPRLKGKKTVFEMEPKTFSSFGTALAAAGATLVGGCCGTTPGHIAALAAVVKDTPPVSPGRRAVAAVSSARSHRVFLPEDPLVVIGERINPTGKKALQEDLAAGRFDGVRRLAREQTQQGADLLDVNVGVPGIDEVRVMREAVKEVVKTTPLPLVMDSPNAEALEAALRIYPGRALVNSISGEEGRLAKMMPIAAKYGAMFILLPLRDGEVPRTFEGRRAIVRDVYQRARRWGFTKEDIVVDGLVMTVAADPGAAKETLKTVSWCRDVFHCRTVAGVSNCSFGMPERRWLNGALLALAQQAGLTMAIINPGGEEIMGIKRAADVLLGRTDSASVYVQVYRTSSAAPRETPRKMDPARELQEAVYDGDRSGVVARVEKLLHAGWKAKDVVDEIMIPAIVEVGDRYDRREYFLPQLMAAAETMAAGLAYLEPLLTEKRGDVAAKGKILLATVRGDIHDIGKNIVALMLRNHGFSVTDLGKDVPTETIIRAMKELCPQVVGLSALMTTTMAVMKEVIEAARREGLSTPFILGGAVVTEAYARSLGAAYGRDGVDAVRAVEALVIGGKRKNRT